MARAVLLAVDENPAGLESLERELDRRYGQDYRVICTSSAGHALQALEELASRGEPVAIILAGLVIARITSAPSAALGVTSG